MTNWAYADFRGAYELASKRHFNVYHELVSPFGLGGVLIDL